MRQKNIVIVAILLLLTAVAIGAGLSRGHEVEAAEGGEAQAPQAMPVDMVVVVPQKIQIWKNFSGHVVAVDRAEIRPQVSGRITEIRFEDGQSVQKGDILIVIDPRPYEATLSQVKAALSVAKTKVDLAKKEYDRAKKLIQTEAISQSLLDERDHKYQSAVAVVKGAKALVQSAQINLDYAYVKAPISGKIGRAEITEGNLLQTGSSAPLLTSIVADEKVYVDFEVDEKTYLKSAKAGASNQNVKIPVRLKLLGDDYENNGVVHSFDNRIDPSSGTIRARAIFDNEQKLLLAGMSVSVMMGAADEAGKILISEHAIGTDQDRKFVYIVNDEDKAEYREVKIGESIKGERVILSGLKAGETVITEGLVRIRPGVLVTPKEIASVPSEGNVQGDGKEGEQSDGQDLSKKE